ARALVEQPADAREQLGERGESARRDADPAGVPLVDEDAAAADLRVERRRDAAEVAAVAEREQRQQRDRRVLGGVQRAEEVVRAAYLGRRAVDLTRVSASERRLDRRHR